MSEITGWHPKENIHQKHRLKTIKPAVYFRQLKRSGMVLPRKKAMVPRIPSFEFIAFFSFKNRFNRNVFLIGCPLASFVNQDQREDCGDHQNTGINTGI